MTEIVAEREFELHPENGVQTVIKVVLFKPYQVEDEKDNWKCEWEIQKSGKTIKRYGTGIDSLQALRIGVDMVRIEIESFTSEYKGELTFLNQSLLWV